MQRFATLFLALFLAINAGAQQIPDRFILQLSGESAAAYAVRLNHRPHATDAMFRSRVAALKLQHAQVRRALESKGAQVLGETTAVTNMIFVRMPSARAGDLSSVPGVLKVYPVRKYSLNLDHALPLEMVPDAWNQIGGSANAGVGVKVGVIDTGIDPQHPGFTDPALVTPSGFPIVDNDTDATFATNKVIVARSYALSSADNTLLPAMPTDGHGTGVAMIVAGGTVTGPYGPITGISPKAFLGNYRVFDDQSGAADDWIIEAINDAVADGMDIITMSLGSLVAERPEGDPLAVTVEAAFTAGKIVTISAGNSGPNPNTIGSPGTAPDAITVGARPNDRTFAGSVQVDGTAPILALPGNGTNSPTPISGPLGDVSQNDPTGMACNGLPSGSLSGAVALILRGVCTFSTKLNNAQAAGAIAAIIYDDAARADAFGMDVQGAALPATAISYADGTALLQLSAAGPVNVTVGFSPTAFPADINHLTSFSSRGPSSGGAIKPDLIAVGENVYTATLNQDFVVESGTSFSSPMLAGAAALLLAARPGLSNQQYRSLLINSATPVMQNSGALLTTQQEGSGFLNVLAGLNSAIAASPTSISYGIGAGTFDQTAMLTLTNVGTVTDTFSLTALPLGSGPAPTLSANSVSIDPGQSQTISVELAGTSLDPGAYEGYLQIQGTQSQAIATIPYWYGVPSGTAVNMTILNAPASGAPNSRQQILVRPTDAQGLPASATPTVTVTSGTGRVIAIDSVDEQVPGAYRIQVRVAAGTNVFHIASGSAAADITIQSP